MKTFALSFDAQRDLFEIWLHIADDSVDLANRIEREFYSLFESLANMPTQGHARRDLTDQKVLFFPLYSYLVVYQPDVIPIRIVAILRGRRNIKRILRDRV